MACDSLVKGLGQRRLFRHDRNSDVAASGAEQHAYG